MQKLTIGIDGYNLAMPRGTGIATYGFNLAHALRMGGHAVSGVFGLHVGRDTALRETLFFDRIGQELTGRVVFGGRWRRRFRMLHATFDRRLTVVADDVPLSGFVDRKSFADRLPEFDRLTSAAGLFALAQRHFAVTGKFLPVHMKDPPQIMHWTYPVPVRLGGSRNIYTIHDLVPLRLPFTTLTDKRKFAALLQRCVIEADHICTVSEYSRQDIVDHLSLDPARVSNTYQSSRIPESVEHESFSTCARKIKGLFGLEPRSFFLFFGALEPKKNLGRLLEAYLGLNIDIPLVLVGARSWLCEGELSLLPDNDPRIIRLDYLGRDTLLRLIRVARAVMFPSIFEGFGLPALEAMQLGTSVLTSDCSSLPEIVGDAAILVDPYDTDSIANGILQLALDDNLLARLERAGPLQAQRFAQTCFLERLEAMYSQVLDGPVSRLQNAPGRRQIRVGKIVEQ